MKVIKLKGSILLNYIVKPRCCNLSGPPVLRGKKHKCY